MGWSKISVLLRKIDRIAEAENYVFHVESTGFAAKMEL